VITISLTTALEGAIWMEVASFPGVELFCMFSDFHIFSEASSYVEEDLAVLKRQKI
jgi:hypothetical protein